MWPGADLAATPISRRAARRRRTLPEPPVDQREPVALESNARARRWTFWLGLGLVWLFAGGFLQFGLLEELAAPASERVNNGREPTFFALHINPYYVFSEDFHLYVVRSKRILDRGWTDALLWSRPDARPNYSAPLQAALMMLAAATDGRPAPYACFLFVVLGIAWSILYLAAARWLPRSVSPLTVPIAVLVTVLFESIDGLFHPATEFGQWPVHRGLRMATLAWSSPLGLALVIALVSLLVERRRPWGRVGFVGAVLITFALADTWAFLLAGAATALVLTLLAAVALAGRSRLKGRLRPLLTTILALTLLAAAALACNRVTSGSIEGDALTRAGFGEKWRQSPLGVLATPHFARQVRSDLVLIGTLALLAFTYVTTRASTAQRLVQTRITWNWPTSLRLFLFCLVAVPVAARAITVYALARFGMDHYSEHQFAWRVHYILLFALVVLVCEGAKHAVRYIASMPRVSSRLEIGASMALLAALFAYHNVRIFEFTSEVAAREFFLTEDAEKLRDWLKKREESLGPFQLATASHELNHLCAYWTNADLLLPEGFSYHEGATNTALEARMARLLAVYGATPQSWREFTLHRHVWDQWSWAVSRLLSARHGYMYYLMHNEVVIDGVAWERPQMSRSGGTTRHYAERRMNHQANIEQGREVAHLAGMRAVERIADQLDKLPPIRASDQPDVIIIDEVSRALGSPNLHGYTREFHHGDLEAWVKSDAGRAIVRLAIPTPTI